MRRFLLTILLTSFFFGLEAKSDSEKKSIEAFSIETEDIKLDGKLDESFWGNIPGITDFLVQEPIEGGIPT